MLSHTSLGTELDRRMGGSLGRGSAAVVADLGAAKDNSFFAPEDGLGSFKDTLACDQDAEIVVIEVHHEGAD
jgi:hypothetical protein